MTGWRTIFFLVYLGIGMLWHTAPTTAQVPGMRKYTQLDGFSATNGYEFSQDARGILWIGTDNGGMSFDGKKFKVLLDKGSFPDAEILGITPLNNNIVLLYPIIGDICYLDKGALVTARQDKRLRIDHSRHNNGRLDPVTGAVWLSDGGRFNTIYCFRDRDIKRYDFHQNLFFVSAVINNRFIGDMTQPEKPYIHHTLISDTNGTFHRLYDETGQAISPEKSVVYSGSDPEYLIFYNKNRTIEAYRYRDGDSILRRLSYFKMPGQKEIYSAQAYLDPNRNLWLKYVGQENIWYCGSIKEKQPQEFFHFLEPGLVNTVFVDRNSNIWFSSKNNALYFLSQKHFRNLLLSQRFPMKEYIPRCISGNGTNGLCISYTNSSKLIAITEKKYHSIQLGKGFEEGCRNIMPLSGNRFIIQGNEIVLYDMNRHTVTPIKTHITCKDICLYGDEDMLVSGSDNVILIPSFLKKNKQPVKLFSARATALGVIQNKAILIGTPKGLFLMQSLKDRARKISDTLIDQHNITDIQSLPDGGALIGTNARGLIHYDAKGKLSEVQKGKLNNIRSIYRQNDSVYWTSTNEGVYRLSFRPDWSVKEVKNYTFYDGLPSNSATSVYVSQDTAYVATSGGLGILPLKDSALLQMAPPDIYLNTLQAGKSGFHYPDTPLVLPREQNNLLFSLSAISYESLGQIQYYYRLYPLQKDWVHTTDPDIRFAQLPAGHYTFQAYALNAKGVRSVKTVALAIYLQPAFWETSYFKLALLVLAALLFYLLLRWWLLRREKRKYRKVQEKKRLAELELEAIKAQINPHFIYNCLNSIQYLNYKAEHQQAQQYLDLFARLIRMTMQYSQQAFISLEEETDYLSLYLQLEKLRFKDKLQYNIRIDGNMSKSTLLPAMLIQPYVENALKHGVAGKPAGEICISFSEEAGRLIVVIQDNGAGFPDTQKRQGALGLKLSGTRALSYNELFNLDIRIHRYNLQDIDPAGTGAVVTINMLSFGNIIPEKKVVG